MTVKELIAELNRLNPDLEVRFATDYGDYNHTEVAYSIDHVYPEKVTYSDYHGTMRRLTETEDAAIGTDFAPETTEVVILK